MEIQSLIKAFQKELSKFDTNQTTTSFSESFSLKRFAKKYQVPDPSINQRLSKECWDNWIKFDHGLPKGDKHFYDVFQKNPTFWYNVRRKIRKNVLPVVYNSKVDFSPGSTFTPTHGHNSVEAKLASLYWDCTDANFDAFARIAYHNNALKKAIRHKWSYFYKSKGYNFRECERVLFRHVIDNPIIGKSIGFRIFSLKLRFVLPECRGSRFVSIPKNNETRRPINIEPFCNVVVQKQIGADLRKQLKRIFQVDLDTLADTHKVRISNSNVATIDLKNASDAISLALCKFLLPPKLFKQLLDARSPYIYEDEQGYHLVNKISAMGNGFTFELMTLILTFVCRELDPTATVFGDDIIIAKDQARALISFLNDMGFVVNESKSFIDGPFRESCGGNYHDEEGYIKSFDFLYPENIHDCVVIYNKVRELALCYASFKKLERELFRKIPPALRGGALGDAEMLIQQHKTQTAVGRVEQSGLSSYFCTGTKAKFGVKIEPQKFKKLKRKLSSLGIEARPTIFIGFTSEVDRRSGTIDDMISHLHWSKYLMYLYAGRKADDIITGSTTWVEDHYVTVDERTFRLSSLIDT